MLPMSENRHTRTREKFPSRRDAHGLLCAFCGKRLSGRQRRWCSSACANAAWEQCSPAYAAQQCEKRANGICHDCGINTRELDRALWDMKGWHFKDPAEALMRAVLGNILAIMWRAGWNCHGGRFPHWDALGHAHHLVHHAEGGPLHPDNLIWLCVPCHKRRHGHKSQEEERSNGEG